MWYLQTELLTLIAGLSLVLGILRRVAPAVSRYTIPLVTLAAIWYIDAHLALFVAAYVTVGFALCRLLARLKRGAWLLIFSLAVMVPLFMSRLDVFGVELPFIFVSIGIAFHMLRLIDTFYYAHYTGSDVRFIVFVNYMLLLPVFTAGPLFRYRDFQKSFDNPLKLDGELFTHSFKRVIRGLFKKVVLAALLLELFRWVVTLQAWYFSLAAIALSYSVIYFDLAGYSDIAIAFGRLMGYDVPENFKRPWAAATFTQFWRSWHSTLSDWIREHIYVLVGRRKIGKVASAAIGFCAMVLMSLWHGFNVPYLVAGAYNGLFLAAENLLSLTTVPRKSKLWVVVLRCFSVNFLFAVNTLVFLLPWEDVVGLLQRLFGVVSA